MPQVRILSLGPRRSKLCIACSDLFYKSERTHAAAPPFQIEPAALGFDLVWPKSGGLKSYNYTRTISLKNRRYRRFFCISGITDAGRTALSVLLYTVPAMMEPYRKGRCSSCFITANEVIAGSSTRKRVFSSAALPRRRSARSRRCPRRLMPATGSADAAIPSSVSIEKSRWLS